MEDKEIIREFNRQNTFIRLLYSLNCIPLTLFMVLIIFYGLTELSNLIKLSLILGIPAFLVSLVVGRFKVGYMDKYVTFMASVSVIVTSVWCYNYMAVFDSELGWTMFTGTYVGICYTFMVQLIFITNLKFIIGDGKNRLSIILLIGTMILATRFGIRL